MSKSRKLLKRMALPSSMAAVGIFLILGVGCRKTEPNSTTTSQQSSQDEAKIQDETKPKWDYSAERGPEKWGELSPDYVLAAIGRSQSPIDIVTQDVITADLPLLEFDTHPTDLKVLNNGHSVEFIAPGGSTLNYRGQAYKLTQYHFHTPSEHTIDGKHADVEVHFVHSDGAGQLAVVAVLYDEGDEDHPSFLILDDQAPTKSGDEKIFPETDVDVRGYFPSSAKQHKYFMYDGSLTTPPASEGVRWFICTETVSVSRRQIDIVKNLYVHNNRPVQPAHSRLVLTPRRAEPGQQK